MTRSGRGVPECTWMGMESDPISGRMGRLYDVFVITNGLAHLHWALDLK